MEQYIDKAALVAEIERRLEELYELLPDAGKVEKGIITISEACNTGKYTALESFKDYIDTLEVKEADNTHPRFPHYKNIVDKVFGAGNLESWEYEEAKQLVLLAKDELLKDIETDLESEIENVRKSHFINSDFDKATLDGRNITNIAKHFFELGLKVQKGEKV